MNEEEIVKGVISRLDDKPRRFKMYAEQTIYYSAEIEAYNLEEAHKKFDAMEIDYNMIEDEGETIHTKTTEIFECSKTDVAKKTSYGWDEEKTLWERE